MDLLAELRLAGLAIAHVMFTTESSSASLGCPPWTRTRHGARSGLTATRVPTAHAAVPSVTLTIEGVVTQAPATSAGTSVNTAREPPPTGARPRTACDWPTRPGSTSPRSRLRSSSSTIARIECSSGSFSRTSWITRQTSVSRARSHRAGRAAPMCDLELRGGQLEVIVEGLSCLPVLPSMSVRSTITPPLARPTNAASRSA